MIATWVHLLLGKISLIMKSCYCLPDAESGAGLAWAEYEEGTGDEGGIRFLKPQGLSQEGALLSRGTDKKLPSPLSPGAWLALHFTPRQENIAAEWADPEHILLPSSPCANPCRAV